MKKTILFAMAILFLASSCKKEETASVEKLSEAEAVEVMQMSVETESMGVTEQMEEVAMITTQELMGNPLCGSTMDTTIVKQFSNGTSTVDFTFNWHKVINCTGNVVSDFTYTYTASGQYNSPRMTTSNTANGTLVLSQFSPSFTAYLATVNYTRNGTHVSKIGGKNSFTSTLTATSTNILIDKSSMRVTSGTMDITMTGSTNRGSTFSFSGVITFLGNGQATITLSNGTVYNVSL